MMKRISVIGLFREGQKVADGQSVKTRIVTDYLENFLGKEAIRRIDTYEWKKHPARLFYTCVKAVQNSAHVIFMTDAGGIKVFPWLLTLANRAHKCRIHYVVIGAWLNSSLEHNHLRRHWLSKLDGIYVETNTMKIGLEGRGLTNVILMPNCKPLTVLKENELPAFETEPYALCTFSRVMREKGIQEAVEAVQEINRRHGRKVFTLDIYGRVDPEQEEWFEKLEATFTEDVRYGGVIPYQKSVEVLKQYFALLFPTKLYYIEGVPGTIIDTYAAGVPVIASRWESCADIIDEETGIVYNSGSYSELLEILERVATDPSLISRRRHKCLQRAGKYAPDQVMQILLQELK